MLKTLHWVKSRAHPLQSPVTNLQYSQPPYTCKLFTIQPTPFTRSSSFSQPPSLLISCSPTKPYPSLHHVFGYLPPKLCTFSLPPPPITNHHLHPPPLSITTIYLSFPLKTKLSSFQNLSSKTHFRNSYPDSFNPPSSHSCHKP